MAWNSRIGEGKERNLRPMPKKSLLAPAALALAVCLPTAARAAGWSSTNVEYLYGWNWDPSMGDEMRGIVTLEHVSGFAYGDNFFFVDITSPTGRNKTLESVYGQWDPRISLSKISDSKLAFGPIGDVLLTGELGYGAVPVKNLFQREYNYGLGFDIKMPGFAYFAINFWVHDTPYHDGATYQISPYWGAPFHLGTVGFLAEGFLDFIGPEGKTGVDAGRSEMSLITQPRFLLDVGSLWKKEGNLFAGTEVAVWWNEFGVKDKNEFVPQAMVKWVF
jgi:nucleoside-specific outer membrane channel protein Tsx